MKKIKRTIDFILSLLLIVLLSPIFVYSDFNKNIIKRAILYNWDVIGKNGIHLEDISLEQCKLTLMI